MLNTYFRCYEISRFQLSAHCFLSVYMPNPFLNRPRDSRPAEMGGCVPAAGGGLGPFETAEGELGQ